MRTIFVTGCDGYTGWPIVLKLLTEFPDARIIGADNGGRRAWVKEVGADSFLKISTMKMRAKKVNTLFNSRFSYHPIDLTDYRNVFTLINFHKPDIVLHLAAQPSAPYSHRSALHCSYTQHNNISMLTNIMFALNESDLNDTHLVVTTTTGIYGAPDYDIPEGNVVLNQMELPHPSMGGSWYHMSRAFDSANLWLGNRQFKFPISEMRTAIVTGSSTKETRQYKLPTRFDVDADFGVVTNRFAVQALRGEPITIYGKGEQMKPMVSLEDMTSSMVQICKVSQQTKYEIYNQVERPIAIIELAKAIKDAFKQWYNVDIEVKHILNPRIENEEHKMIIDNQKFLQLIGGIRCSVSSAISQICKDLKRKKK